MSIKIHARQKFLSTFWYKALPTAISIAAMVFTCLQWHDAHNQMLLSMKPSLNITMETDVDDPPVGVNIANAGPGPATIKSLIYYFDRRPFTDVDQIVNLGKLDATQTQTYTFDSGDTLAVGENHFLLKHEKRGKEDQAELTRFTDLVDDHLGVEVEFCPVMPGDCYKKCTPQSKCGK